MRHVEQVPCRVTRTLTGSFHNAMACSHTVYPEVPLRVEYALTHLGVSLVEHVLGLAMWASAHTDEIRKHRNDFDSRQS